MCLNDKDTPAKTPKRILVEGQEQVERSPFYDEPRKQQQHRLYLWFWRQKVHDTHEWIDKCDDRDQHDPEEPVRSLQSSQVRVPNTHQLLLAARVGNKLNKANKNIICLIFIHLLLVVTKMFGKS